MDGELLRQTGNFYSYIDWCSSAAGSYELWQTTSDRVATWCRRTECTLNLLASAEIPFEFWNSFVFDKQIYQLQVLSHASLAIWFHLVKFEVGQCPWVLCTSLGCAVSVVVKFACIGKDWSNVTEFNHAAITFIAPTILKDIRASGTHTDRWRLVIRQRTAGVASVQIPFDSRARAPLLGGRPADWIV
jgi:hypothetical protein